MFDQASKPIDEPLFKQCLRLLFTICEHWLRLPYPVSDCTGVSSLLSSCDRGDCSTEFDVSIECGLLFLYALNRGWTDDLNLMIRVVFGSVGVRASVSRRIQFEKVLRSLYAALNARLHLNLSSLTAGGMSLNAFEECLQRVPEFLSVSTLRMREERRREVMVEALSALTHHKSPHCVLSLIATNSEALTPEQAVAALLAALPDGEFAVRVHVVLVMFLLAQQSGFADVLADSLTVDTLRVLLGPSHSAGSVAESPTQLWTLQMLFLSLCTGDWMEGLEIPTLPLATTWLLPAPVALAKLHVRHLKLFSLWCEANLANDAAMEVVSELTNAERPLGRVNAVQLQAICGLFLRHASESAPIRTVLLHILSQSASPTFVSILLNQIAQHSELLSVLSAIPIQAKANPCLILSQGDSVLVAFEESAQPLLTIHASRPVPLELLPDHTSLLYQEPMKLPVCSAVILQGDDEPIEVMGIELSLHKRPWAKFTPTLHANLILDPEQPPISATIRGNPVLCKNTSLPMAIRSLGGISCLFPLLQIDPNNRTYLKAVLDLLASLFSEVSEDDWLLFSELLCSIDPAILNELLPGFTAKTRSNGSKALLNPHLLSRLTVSLRELGFRAESCDEEVRQLVICDLMEEEDVSEELRSAFHQVKSCVRWNSELVTLCPPSADVMVRMAMKGEFREDLFLKPAGEIEKAVCENGNVEMLLNQLETRDNDTIEMWIPYVLKAIESSQLELRMLFLAKLKQLLNSKNHPYLQKEPISMMELCLHPIEIGSPLFSEILKFPHFEVLYTIPKPLKSEWLHSLQLLMQLKTSNPSLLQNPSLLPLISVLCSQFLSFYISESDSSSSSSSSTTAFSIDTLLTNWSFIRSFLAVLLLFPASSVFPQLQTVFSRFIPLFSSIPSPDEEDLLFVTAPSSSSIPPSTLKSMQNAMNALVSQLLPLCDPPHLALLYSQITAVAASLDPSLPPRVLQALQAQHVDLTTALQTPNLRWAVDETPDWLCLAETPVSPHWRELCDVALTRVLLQ